MKTLLIFPPMVDAVHPPLGIATIAGHLKQVGNKDVENLDLNVKAHYYFLNSQYFTEKYTIIKSRYDILKVKADLAEEEKKELAVLSEAVSNADYLINNIDSKVELLKKSSSYHDLDGYYKLTDFFRQAQNYVSASVYPTSWSIEHQFTFKYSIFKTKEVLQAVYDKEQNPFIEYYQYKMPEILEKKAGLIGISICYFEQLIPALTLISLLKKTIKT